MRLANSLVATGEIELMSMTSLPFDRPLATPFSPNSTFSTSGVSGTIVMIASAFSATSVALGAGDHALALHVLRHARAARQKQFVSGLAKVLRHGAAHEAEFDETDFHGAVLSLAMVAFDPANFGLLYRNRHATARARTEFPPMDIPLEIRAFDSHRPENTTFLFCISLSDTKRTVSSLTYQFARRSIDRFRNG